MSERTFFAPPSAFFEDRAVLEGEELRHARLTLRLGVGDQVRLVDGEGGAFDGRIETMAPRAATVRVLSSEAEPAPSFSLTLAMGIVGGERFEWALQKGAELGATGFVPLVTERTQVNVRGRWKRRDRLERILVAACKQCGRARFPILHEPVALEALDPSSFDLAVFFWESPEAVPLAAKGRPRSALMVVGPVGGFTDREAADLIRRGFLPAGLGPRILRTETAAAAGAVLMQYLYGDMGLQHKMTQT